MKGRIRGHGDLLRRARFMRSGDDGGDIVACSSREAAARTGEPNAASLATEGGHCGAIAFSRRRGDPALGDFEDAVILKTVGEVNTWLLSV
jgi:hypothetical protein